MGDEGKERCKDGKNKGKNRKDRTKDQDWVVMVVGKDIGKDSGKGGVRYEGKDKGKARWQDGRSYDKGKNSDQGGVGVNSNTMGASWHRIVHPSKRVAGIGRRLASLVGG